MDGVAVGRNLTLSKHLFSDKKGPGAMRRGHTLPYVDHVGAETSVPRTAPGDSRSLTALAIYERTGMALSAIPEYHGA